MLRSSRDVNTFAMVQLWTKCQFSLFGLTDIERSSFVKQKTRRTNLDGMAKVKDSCIAVKYWISGLAAKWI